MSTKRNIFQNGMANIFQSLIKLIDHLLLVPFFISVWGVELYGEWLTLTIIPAVLGLANLGFGSAAGNSFVLKYVSGDKKAAANIEKTGFIVISFAVLLGIVLTVIVMVTIIKIGWLDKLIIPNDTAIKTLIFMMAARLVTFYNQFFYAYFRSARRAALGINLVSINNLLQLALGIIVLISGGGIFLFALSQFLISICFVVFFGWKAIEVLGLKVDNKKFDRNIAKDIVKTGIGYLTFPAWQAIFLQGTTFVVRIVLGPAAVAVFNTVRMLVNSVHQLIDIIKNSVFPELQFELGIGNIEKAQNLFVNTIRISILLSSFVVMFLAFFGIPLYNIWTHKMLSPPIVMWYLFLFALLIKSGWWVTEMVYQAQNKPYQLGIPALCVALISVAFSYFTCLWLGLTGAVLGSVVFDIIMLLYILPTSFKLMGMSVREMFDFKAHKFLFKLNKI